MDVEKGSTWNFRPRPRRRLARYLVAVVACLILLQCFGFSVFYSNNHPPTSSGRIQHDFSKGSVAAGPQPDRLKAVKSEFLHAWNGYRDHAWMADSLMSLTGGRKNQFCGWSATLIDSLDTLWIMGLKDEFEDAVAAAVQIDFAASVLTCEVNTFETTIRYLGGLLAAYDLSQDARLLPKINEIGDLLHQAFDSTNGMPCSHCRFPSTPVQASIQPGASVPLADLGSFYLEFARLSQITGKRKYMDTVKFLTNTFEEAQNQSSIPGLWPEMLDATSIGGSDPTFVSTSSVYSLGALSDSAYEYLVKTHLLLGRSTKQYANMWKKAAHQIRQNLLFRAYIPDWKETNTLFSGLATRSFSDSEASLEPRTQHLACFAGGMFAMASRVFNEPDDLAIGEGLTNGCVWAYDHAPTGIMPETFGLLPCPEVGRQCAWNTTLWSNVSGLPERCVVEECEPTYGRYPPGYLSSIDYHYALRPEAIESVFILYRTTGDQKWREAGWRMFQSIIKHTRTDYGHASLSSTMQLSNRTTWDHNREVYEMLASQRDEMESFWLAETLKYFWLLFSDTDVISLDEWVLNTEAHPLRLHAKWRGFG